MSESETLGSVNNSSISMDSIEKVTELGQTSLAEHIPEDNNAHHSKDHSNTCQKNGHLISSTDVPVNGANIDCSESQVTESNKLVCSDEYEDDNHNQKDQTEMNQHTNVKENDRNISQDESLDRDEEKSVDAAETVNNAEHEQQEYNSSMEDEVVDDQENEKEETNTEENDSRTHIDNNDDAGLVTEETQLTPPAERQLQEENDSHTHIDNNDDAVLVTEETELTPPAERQLQEENDSHTHIDNNDDVVLVTEETQLTPPTKNQLQEENDSHTHIDDNDDAVLVTQETQLTPPTENQLQEENDSHTHIDDNDDAVLVTQETQLTPPTEKQLQEENDSHTHIKNNDDAVLVTEETQLTPPTENQLQEENDSHTHIHNNDDAVLVTEETQLTPSTEKQLQEENNSHTHIDNNDDAVLVTEETQLTLSAEKQLQEENDSHTHIKNNDDAVLVTEETQLTPPTENQLQEENNSHIHIDNNDDAVLVTEETQLTPPTERQQQEENGAEAGQSSSTGFEKTAPEDGISTSAETVGEESLHERQTISTETQLETNNYEDEQSFATDDKILSKDGMATLEHACLDELSERQEDVITSESGPVSVSDQGVDNKIQQQVESEEGTNTKCTDETVTEKGGFEANVERVEEVAASLSEELKEAVLMSSSDTLKDELQSVPDGPPLDLLLIGRTGNGKTSICKTIIESTEAIVESTTESILNDTSVDGRRIRLLDTPGTIDNKDSDVTLREIGNIFAINPHGFHAILFVIQYGRAMSNDELRWTKMIKRLFGEDVFENYVILVFTHGDKLRKDMEKDGLMSGDIKNFVDQHHGLVKDLLTECKQRMVLFDNTEIDVIKRRKQVCTLVSMVDGIVDNNGGKRYDNSYFKLAKKETEFQKSTTLTGNETDEERRALEDDIKVQVGQVVAEQIKKDNALCFPADAVVFLSSGDYVTMQTLRVGDEILSRTTDGKLVYSKVYMFGHAENDVMLPCITIRTSTSSISISPGHYMFVDRGTDSPMPVLAGDVKCGDGVYVFSTSADIERTTVEIETVIDVYSTVCSGRFSPFTECGTIIVNDILASCYVGLLPHSLSHVLLWPVRKMYGAFPGLFAILSYSRLSGIPSWVHWCMKSVLPRLPLAMLDNRHTV